MLKIATENLSNEMADFIDFLLTEKKADPNIADMNGYTPLHQLSKQVESN